MGRTNSTKLRGEQGDVIVLEAIAVIAVVVIVFALFSRLFTKYSVSAALLFMVVGIMIGERGAGLLDTDIALTAVALLAEVTLIIVLFTDAAKVHIMRLLSQSSIPVRMLLVGLPLTVIAGTFTASWLFPALTMAQCALLAAILTPTDAALGQAIVTNKNVPLRIRQSLNVESGLNDGLMLPAITILAALSYVATSHSLGIHFVASQIGFGVASGLVIGLVGAWSIRWAEQVDVMSRQWKAAAILAIAVVAFSVAHVVHGNGFIAAFIAGMCFATVSGAHMDSAVEFVEEEGQLLSALTFLFFGASLVTTQLGSLSWQVVVYAVLSVTLLRMIPVGVSLTGFRIKLPTIALLGWCGPRGLASILFLIMVMRGGEVPHMDTVTAVVVWTCVLSIAAHGLSAVSVAKLYARWYQQHPERRTGTLRESHPYQLFVLTRSLRAHLPHHHRDAH